MENDQKGHILCCPSTVAAHNETRPYCQGHEIDRAITLFTSTYLATIEHFPNRTESLGQMTLHCGLERSPLF